MDQYTGKGFNWSGAAPTISLPGEISDSLEPLFDRTEDLQTELKWSLQDRNTSPTALI